MRHKNTIQLYRYWNELRGDAAAPERADIAPAAVGSLLPAVMLLDITDNGEAVFRLAGSRLCTLRCAELKDLPIAEIFQHEDRARMRNILKSVQRENSLVVLDVSASRPGGSGVALEMAFFPLAGKTTKILGIASVLSIPDWIGEVPAVLGLRGVRFLNTEASLTFLQSRPSIPVSRRRVDAQQTNHDRWQVLSGKAEIGITRPIRAFRVIEGGKTRDL